MVAHQHFGGSSNSKHLEHAQLDVVYKHNIPSKLRTVNTGVENQGRKFYGCALWPATLFSQWKIHRSACYSMEHCDDPVNTTFTGVIQAHDAWVTALSWGFLASDSSPRFYWLLVFVMAAQSPRKILLAVGKGSGSFQLWTCNIKVKSANKVGSYDAHVQAVTGLACAFDVRYLYSCSQDNSLHGWIYHKGFVYEVSVPSNNLGTKSFYDLPSESDSCYGVAISPGNLALAVV
ncbi:hypothetical protein BVRB_8g201950 [Beta vulgaris subsp. vulgaris]|uniref:Uncharacterized protein n=1 Tax=Beta vulgaris subsp. vulgaris TaxID=3555 RepID=A0A0J8E0E4_BETVV|nr:hypothetical protein BVRB_8g201950 [Beta vulgaris subsp. vulgaris]